MNHAPKDPLKDSAGVPWAGRAFGQSPWQQDDGSAPPELARALAIFSTRGAGIDSAGTAIKSAAPLATPGSQALFDLVEALRGTRLLVPLVAEIGEAEVGPHGKKVDKSADLAIVAVATPDGKTAIPAFSSVLQMQGWRKEARPVPIEAVRVMLAAAGEGHERVIIDPAGPAVALRRPAIAALAQGLAWQPPELSAEVAQLVAHAVSQFDLVTHHRLYNPDPWANLAAAELGIELGLPAGLTPQLLDIFLREFADLLQTPEFTNLVDSIAIRLVVR